MQNYYDVLSSYEVPSDSDKVPDEVTDVVPEVGTPVVRTFNGPALGCITRAVRQDVEQQMQNIINKDPNIPEVITHAQALIFTKAEAGQSYINFESPSFALPDSIFANYTCAERNVNIPNRYYDKFNIYTTLFLADLQNKIGLEFKIIKFPYIYTLWGRLHWEFSCIISWDNYI